eukprot:2043240-Prymnesium_polylepis.2
MSTLRALVWSRNWGCPWSDKYVLNRFLPPWNLQAVEKSDVTVHRYALRLRRAQARFGFFAPRNYCNNCDFLFSYTTTEQDRA